MAPMNIKSPGIYINELSTFPNSVVPVPTGIPAFIGFTEKAEYNGEFYTNKAVRLNSLREFELKFGKGAAHLYTLTLQDQPTEKPKNYDLLFSSVAYSLMEVKNTQFKLYDAVRFFYQNGGSSFYVISVGTYAENNNNQEFSDTAPFTDALDILKNETEPAIIVIPDALLFSSTNCNVIQEYMLNHCADQKNRVAILDIHEGCKALDDPDGNPVQKFRDQISSSGLSFGAAYYPWLHTTVVNASEISYLQLNPEGRKTLKNICDSAIVSFREKQKKELVPVIDQLTVFDENPDTEKSNKIHLTLSSQIPEYKMVMDEMLKKKNLLPPSAAIAGVYCQVDQSKGVWIAPANVSLNSVVSPAVLLNDQQTDYLNSPLDGKAICSIRAFSGRGTLIWGARTLDANNSDWRYINVRRTMIMLEQSIQNGIKPYVFEPNDASTWVNIQSTVSSFLINIWKEGGLIGATSKDAFNVMIGLGVTMTTQDILDGRLVLQVLVAIRRPAEFMIITLEQQQINS